MRVVVVGGGPVGIFSAMALARRGDDVTVVDRDRGPPMSGPWARRGVMQFPHPHFFRSMARRALLESLPDVWDALISAGGVPARPDGLPEEATGLACRRSVFERVLWAGAASERRLRLRTGHTDRLVTDGGRITGVVVDGAHVDADLVIVAAGRASRLAGDTRPPAEGGACGFSYVSRMYRARPGVEPPSGMPIGSLHRGYLTIVFPQDDRTLCALIVRASDDTGLALVRNNASFDAIVARIPQLAEWTDPNRFEPITDALPGSGLTNTYRAQVDSDGRPAAAGGLFVGDAVCTTNPAAGRGISLGLQQATTLLRLLGESDDAYEVALRFDAWCSDHIRPWW